MSENMGNRPISPHITIYRPQISSITSITHRITGFLLYVALVTLIWVLSVIFFCNYSSDKLHDVFSQNETVKLFLKINCVFFIFAISYHFLNGVRHLSWDSGLGFKVKTSNITGIIVIMLSLLITIFISYKNLF